MIEGLKPVYNMFLKPFAIVFVKLRISPNGLTFIGLFLFVIAGYLSAIGQWQAAALTVCAGACFDGLDGLVARQTNQVSHFGAFFDSVCDRLTEILWLGGIGYWYLAQNQLPILEIELLFAVITGSLMVSYLRARSEGIGINCSRGIMQRPERLTILGFGQLFGERAFYGALVVVAILAWLTVLERILHVWNISRGDNPEKRS